eukprot:4934408-Pyramimonas_sp.AAC.1
MSGLGWSVNKCVLAGLAEPRQTAARRAVQQELPRPRWAAKPWEKPMRKLYGAVLLLGPCWRRSARRCARLFGVRSASHALRGPNGPSPAR